MKIQQYFCFELETCLFEENLKWCISTAEDSYLLLGCKKEIEEEIKQKMNLELFKIGDQQKIY